MIAVEEVSVKSGEFVYQTKKLLTTRTNWFSTMKPVQIYLLLNVIMTTSVLVHTFNPFEGIFGFFKKFWKKVYNPQESCDSTWISFKAKGEDDVRHANVPVVFVELCNLKGQKSVIVPFYR